MAYRATENSSFKLDRKFRGIGGDNRIAMVSGTKNKRTHDRINEMLTALFEGGRLDLLRAIKNKTLTPLQVYDAFRVGDLNRLPSPDMMLPLEETFQKWIDQHHGTREHKASLRQAKTRLVGIKSNATIGELPAMLETLRAQLKKKDHAQTFNKVRTHVLTFVKDTLKRSHPLWSQVMGVERLKVTPKRKSAPATPKQIQAICGKLIQKHLYDKTPFHYGHVTWVMATTGMGPKEWAGDWEPQKDRIRINGTKRQARDRVVPKLDIQDDLLLDTAIDARDDNSYSAWYPRFRETFVKASKATGHTMTPYDLRRSYANWMEAAGIPRTRRRAYMGHAAGDVTDLYERHEVTRYLEEDAKKLNDYLAAQLAETEPATEGC